MKTNFTKGEWEHKSIDRECCQVIRTKGTKYYIAEVQSTSEEAKANAKLIAAAPDLFKCLITIQKHYPSIIPEYLKIEIDKAINKATN